MVNVSPTTPTPTGRELAVSSEPERSKGRDFAAFYAEEHDGQVRRAFLMLRSSPLAHDVVADAFIAVFNRWSTIDAPGPYLSRCVLNGCRDASGREQRERPAADLPERSSDAADEHLADVLMTLPFRQRAAVVLRFYGGMNEKQIAEQLECRPGTVGSLIHRGLTHLKNELSNGDAR